jgi:predicted lactoylglutathione lyase
MQAEMSAMSDVKDVGRSVEFYRQLGFDVCWEWKRDHPAAAVRGTE